MPMNLVMEEIDECSAEDCSMYARCFYSDRGSDVPSVEVELKEKWVYVTCHSYNKE